MKVGISDYSGDIDHACQKCWYLISKESSNIINHLPELEPFLSLSTSMALFYIAGNVSRKNDISEDKFFNKTIFYYQMYGVRYYLINR